MNHKIIVSELIKFGEYLNSQNTKKEVEYIKNNPEANLLLNNNKNAFLFGVLFDEGQKAERAWEHPFLLKKRLGHLDINKISKMKLIDLIEIFKKKPQLRMPSKSACFTLYGSQLLLKKYKGNAENIWLNIKDGNVILERLNEFYGMGQKKRSMALNSLVRDYGHEIKDKSMIDVSFDVHIKKVFFRSGLVNNITEEAIIEKARELSPNYPGALDLPCWVIGRNWCKPKKPLCDKCRIGKYCGKKNLEITEFNP